MRTGIIYAALGALVMTPGVASAKTNPQVAPAAPISLPYQSAGLPTAGQVQAFYAGWRYAPIWFDGAVPNAAANSMISILQRSSLDGIASGPQYAAQIQAALQQAATGSPQAIAFAEHSLSEALVLYAQMMDRPIPDMTYGYDYMKPTPPSAGEVLKIAAGAPSLPAYLQQVANPNSIYVSIRDTAWQQMQAAGSTVPDPRVVANLERTRGMPAKGRFVLVNPATQMLTMYENGVPVDSMRVVVGRKRDWNLPTPMITSTIFYAVHNPYWNSPDHLTRKNIASLYLAQGDSYLKNRGYEVMSDWTTNATVIPPSEVDWKAVRAGKIHIRIRQKPGPENFMGEIKFPFANPQDIFLHDVPEKDRFLFKQSQRTESNGCIRLEDAKRLGRWLLGHEPVPHNGDAEEFEQLSRGVPIYVTYITAKPENGQLTFVKDVYGWDPSGGTKVADSGAKGDDGR
ncbi:MAG TPA: L,D-transpeptidase family protein [Sphingomicrobium sp.]|nr:L,D-transpeptidase family protein [Sphingomicrobium sp.]